MALTPIRSRRLIERLEPMNTPENRSWPAMSGLESNVSSRLCPDRKGPDQPTAVRVIGAWERERNVARKPVDCRFTVADARISLERPYA